MLLPLQAINRPRDNVYAFGFAFIIRTALIFVLVSYRPLNIFGAIIAQSVFLIVAATWQIIVIRRHVQLDIKFGSFIARPILLSVGLIMILGLAREMLINQNIWLRLGILGGAACLIYGIVVLFCGVLDETERGYFTKIFSKKVNSRD